MRTSNFQIVPLATEVADAARRGVASGLPDHVVVTVDSATGFPCRHCLQWAQPGERVILFPYPSIPPGRPYSETGPIFVHAKPCERYKETSEYPEPLRKHRVFRAYNGNFEMIDAKVANGSEPEVVIEELLENLETAFVHARSATRGCYTFAIERV